MKIKHIFLSVLILHQDLYLLLAITIWMKLPGHLFPQKYILQRQPIFKPLQIILYSDILPSHGTGNTYGIYKDDATTDNQIEVTAPNRLLPPCGKVDNAETNNWNFDKIYKINFVLSNVLP